MSAPLIWIVFPAAVGLLLYPFRRRATAITLIGSLIALLLAVAAWFLPIAEPVLIGSWSFEITDRLVIAGRQFVLTQDALRILALVYLAAAFWFFGSLGAGVHRMFVPLGLGIVATLTAAFSVRPFLYAALLIGWAVLLSVPLVSPPGKAVSTGVLRFLTFQMLGIPFLLFAGWLLRGAEGASVESEVALRAAILIAAGFAFWLAIFPLYSWIPMLAEGVHPYLAAFTLSTIPGVIMLLFLGFLNRYPLLQNADTLQLIGVLMVATGGFWAAFQRHLGRLLGYAVILSIGHAILAVSLPAGTGMYFALIFSRVLALGLWGLSLSALHTYRSDLSFKQVQGLGRRLPLAALGLMLAHFSMAGFPLLAGYPIYQALWRDLASVAPQIALWTLLGSVGLMAGGLRTMAVLAMGRDVEGEEHLVLSRPTRVLILMGILGLFLAGLFPQWLLPYLIDLPAGF
ncbi:MAG: hypothetical protein JW862_02775 [Anaerolineales bacterium]|nr:hypothetical protein [Anaerolineales bacterium]